MKLFRSPSLLFLAILAAVIVSGCSGGGEAAPTDNQFFKDMAAAEKAKGNAAGSTGHKSRMTKIGSPVPGTPGGSAAPGAAAPPPAPSGQ